MTFIYNTSRRKGAGWPAGRLIPAISSGALLLAFSLAACDSKRVLQVTDPDVANPGSLAGIGALAVVHAGAIGDFQVGYSGDDSDDHEGQIQISALLSDEYINSETFPTRIEIDQRGTTQNNSTLTSNFRDIQRARASADFASAKFEAQAPTDVRRAETMNLAGFSITVMGENHCSGDPLSKLTDAGDIIFGQPRTTAQLWDDAIAKFDSATTIATAATGGANMRNLASIGKGRALLNKGDFAGAATAVANVPTSFIYLIHHSANTGRENNAVWVFQHLAFRFSATDVEGINGLPYRTDNDPRVNETSAGPASGFDGATEVWFVDLPPTTFAPDGKYQDRAASVPMATGVEARLIEAEAALKVSDFVTFLSKINEERTAQGVGVTTLPGTAAAQVDLLFKERAYSMWFTAHRVGDMRRLIRQYGRNSETVFPTGVYFKGGDYGTDVNLILPTDEKNNPNFTGCLDRNP